MITKNEFKDNILGFQITDCAVRNRTSFHFAGRNIEEGKAAGAMSEWKVAKREIGFYSDEKEGDRLGSTNLSNFERTHIGASQGIGFDQVIVIDSRGGVYSRGGGHDDIESSIPKNKDGPRRGAIRRVRMIDGLLYAVGTGHTVCRRKGINDWESFCFNLPLGSRADHEDEERSENMAFVDIDGFSDEDMYVVAGQGIVWNLQGKTWKQIAFPSNMYLESVCCAGDGYVYIGAQSSTVFRGRGDKWKMIHRGDLTLPFKDMVWHAGQLWCTSDYGLWTLSGDDIRRAEEIPSEIMVCAGNLSTADGVMLMAGTNGAAFHDGKKWQLIFNYYQMEQQLAGQ